MICVLVIHPTHRQRLHVVQALQRTADICVAAHTASLAEAHTHAHRQRDAILLIAASLLPHPISPKHQALKQALPGNPWIVTEVPNDPVRILPYLAAGAVGYLVQDASVAEWIHTLHLVADGQAALSPELAAHLIQRIQQLTQQRQQWQHTVAKATTLTPREREILLLLKTARSNAEIATQLGVSVGTVKNHMHSILHKLDLPRRADVKRYLPYLLN